MSKQIKKLLVIAGTLVVNILVFATASAAVSQEGWNPKKYEETGLSGASVENILLTFIDWAIIIVGLLGVIVFIYGGFVYLTARGESDEIEKAKKVLLWGVVGIAVSVLGLVAVKTVDYIIQGNTGSSGTSSQGGSYTGSGGMGLEDAGSGGLPTTPEMAQP